MSQAGNENGLELILPDESDAPRDRWMWGAALVLLVLCVFSPSIWCGYIWDDSRYPLNAAVQNGTDGLYDIWFKPSQPPSVHSKGVYTTPQYYPMTYTSYWLAYEAWGHDPRWAHVVNMVLQAISALLLWEILRRLKVPGAWAAAALFAIHPMQTESVAWLTERKNMLAGVFFFASILVYLRFLKIGYTDDADSTSHDDAGWYWLSLVLFIAGLLSKSIVCTLPVVMGILIWWKRKKIFLKDAALLLPFLACGMAMSGVTSWFEIHIVGAYGPDWAFSPMQRVWIAAHVVWFYVMKLIWPTNLSLIYEKWALTSAEWGYVAATIAVLLVLFFLRKKTGRGPLAAVLIYLVTLVPAMGFINVYPMRYSYVADHFQYLSGVALIVLAVGIIAWALQPLGRARRIVGLILAICVLGIYAEASWSRTHVFTSPETLWRNVIANNPQAWVAYDNLSQVLAEQAENVPVDPQNPKQSKQDADRLAGEAIKMAQHALNLRSNLDASHNSWGRALLVLGKPAEALQQFREAEKLRPNLVNYKNNIAVALKKMGKTAEAEHVYAQGVKLSGDHHILALMHTELAKLLMDDGVQAEQSAAAATNTKDKQSLITKWKQKYAMAEKHLKAATRIDPQYVAAWYQLGLLMIREKNYHDAFDAMSQAEALNPDLPRVHENLGMLLGLQGQYAEAGQEYLKVVKLEPDNAGAYATMGYLAGKLGKPSAAAEFFQTALKLDPNNVRAKQGLALAQSATRPSTTQSTK